MKPYKQLSLGDFAWDWKQADSEEDWRKCSRFPTNIHHELRLLDLIPDEGIGLNERKIQWIGEKDWLFRTSFFLPLEHHEYDHAVLAFDGLDTIATVTLNDENILECDNMFVPKRVEVVGRLGEDNKLEIHFASAARIAREREKKSGKVWQNLRESSRMYVRKAQYHWGWDWGPAMVTCGPWKDIRLELHNARIADVYADVLLSEDCSSARVELQIEVEHPQRGLTLEASVEERDALQRVPVEAESSVYTLVFRLKSPALWWPRGHGTHHMYNANVQLVSGDGAVVHEQTVSFGIRKVELVRRSLRSEEGETFFFRINNRPIFCVGTNWVPCHSLPALNSPELYEKTLSYAVQGNENMVRIWGGGIYENDAFYEYCDSHGIMLWHDMMFACGIYPVDDAFHQSVTEELEAQIRRLRNHPSICLWNGDNEFYFMADRQGLPYDASETGDWTLYPERKLYFETIPAVVQRLSKSIPYWPSSPFGGKDANDPTQGDIHQWDVWHNSGQHYQQYPIMGGRFVSEYGMHGLPDLRTVKYFCPDERYRYPNSKIMDCHNKSGGAEQKMPKYLGANFRLNYTNLEQTIYCSQLMQADALTYANRAWRRGWKGEGREECAGVLIWQLNDIYPCTSWSLVDSFWRKKPAWYTVKRDFAPVMVGISRTPMWHFVNENRRHEHPTDIPKLEIFASNLSMEAKRVRFVLRMYDWSIHEEIALDNHNKERMFTLAPNQATELLQLESPKEVKETSLIVLAATMYDMETGEELSRHFSWPEPYRYLLAAPDATVDIVEEGDAVVVTCGKYPVKGLLVGVNETEGEDAEWADNMVDLMPGETTTLSVTKLAGRRVQCTWLYSWEKR